MRRSEAKVLLEHAKTAQGPVTGVAKRRGVVFLLDGFIFLCCFLNKKMKKTCFLQQKTEFKLVLFSFQNCSN